MLSIILTIDFLFCEWFNVIMKKIFVPIFKTKRSSEKNAIEKTSSLLLESKHVIPYIEAIKDVYNPIVEKYIRLMGESHFFIEPMQNEELDGLFVYENAIPVCLIGRDTDNKTIDIFVKKGEEPPRPIAFRISDSDSTHAKYLEPKLRDKDYLLVDISGNDYSSSLFLSAIKMFFNFKCKIIILSNERSVSASGTDLNKHYNNKYSNSMFFNHSVINAIKNGTFDFDGFASYCGAKNDLTEEVKISNDIYGYLLSFNLDKNAFYVITSDTRSHITKVYNELLDIIGCDYEIVSLYKRTPISRELLNLQLSLGKMSCQKKITIEIVHYLEEIIYNLQ